MPTKAEVDKSWTPEVDLHPTRPQKRTERFDECRTFGHAWFAAETDRRPSWGVYLALRCERCSSERLDNVDRFGNVGARRYEYPDGYSYSATDGEEAPTRTEFRRRYLARFLPELDNG